MNNKLREALKYLSLLAGALIALACLVLAYLAFPARPGKSAFLNFEGFIALSGSKALNILDYLTLADNALFVAGESEGSVFKVALNPDGLPDATRVVELRGSPEAHGVALVPPGKLAFITRSVENTVDVFDSNDMKMLGTIPVADDPDAILYDKASNLVYVASGDAKLATLIDPDKRVTVGTIALSGRPEFPAVDPSTGILYQNLTETNSVAAINLTSRSVVGEWPLAPCNKPAGMAIDSEHRRLFAVCANNAMIVVFDMEKHRVLASLDIVGRPDSVAYDATLHRIYAAGVAGKLTIIQQDDADKYRVVDNIRTHYGAHTLAVDLVGHKVYVGYASLFTHPRIAVFSTR